MTDQEKAAFFDLSIVLEKQLETIIANQGLLIAMHQESSQGLRP